MQATTTVRVSLTTDISAGLLVSEELAGIIFQIFRFVLIPCISVLGISGNLTSIVMLTRQGFQKCSRILLLSLAVSDVLLLFGVNNVPYFIYTGCDLAGFSESFNYMCYLLYIMFDCAYIVGMLLAHLIPVLIIGELIVSILCPLTAHLILTPRRASIVLSCAIFVTAVYSFYHEILGLQLKNDVLQNVTMGISLHTDIWRNHIGSQLYQKITHITNFAIGIISISLVTAGCVVTGLQIVHITKRRQLMISHQVNASAKHGITKTTKTLLTICLLYIVCYGWAFSLIFTMQITITQDGLHLTAVKFCVQDLLLCLNCAGDSLIYLNSNKIATKSKNVGYRIKAQK